VNIKPASRPNSSSVSDILGSMGFKTKPTAIDKVNRRSKLNPDLQNRSLSGLAKSVTSADEDKKIPMENKSNNDSNSTELKSQKSLDEPSGISRLLNFGKKSKLTSKLTVSGSDSSSTPQLKTNNEQQQKRDRELSAVPQNVALPAKAPPGSNSAYDIRGPLNVQKQLTLDDYYLIRRVGKGGFATVFLVRLKGATGRYYALKAMKKAEVVRLRQEKQIMNEKNILMELKHWLLVELYHTFQTPSHLFMIMEFVCGGDLFTLLRKSKVSQLDSSSSQKHRLNFTALK
jgi:Protein kinase domain